MSSKLVKVAGEGILHHHFHGEYSATVILTLPDELSAIAAMRALWAHPSMHWVRDKNRIGVRVHALPTLRAIAPGDTDTCELLIEKLVALGADKGKITSLKKSADVGEPFTFSLEYEAPAGDQQLELGFC
jgi:hypothetical protein